jgi:hypothetical protein
MTASRIELTELMALAHPLEVEAGHSDPPPSVDNPFVAMHQMCFVARLETRRQEEELRSLSLQPGATAEHLLVLCDGCLRRVKKGMEAIIVSLCGLLGTPYRYAGGIDLEASLAVRRAYTLFLQADGEVRDDDSQSLVRQIRTVGTRIAILVGKKAYPSMRLKDRLMFRSLQARIIAWLADENQRIAVGKEILSDFDAAASMLRMINHRSELRQHDAGCLDLALKQLSTGQAPSAVATTLAPVLGLDANIDRLLSSGFNIEVSQLIDLLTQILRSMTGVKWT